MQRALPVKRPATEASQDPARWAAVPGLCCQAAGGDPARAEDLAVAWFCFYVAAHLLDNIEDRDALAGDLGGWPAGVPINLTTGLLFAAGLALDRLHFGDSGKPASHKIPGGVLQGLPDDVQWPAPRPNHAAA